MIVLAAFDVVVIVISSGIRSHTQRRKEDKVFHYVKYLTGSIGTEVPCVKQDVGARLSTRQK